jgi:transcriptional regulator with XRE-family HTH domain
MSTIGKLLKQKREEAKLTQRDVAEVLDYTSSQFVSNWERGIVLPPMTTLPVLKTLYGQRAFREIVDAIHEEKVKDADAQRREMLRMVK